MDWFGWIVLADILDPNGNPCGHPHPAMVLRGPDGDGSLWLIAISTQFVLPLGRLMIECPYAPGGHEETGLDKPCVLKCEWIVLFNKQQIIKYLGRMPPEIAKQAVEFAITARNEAQAKQAAVSNRANQDAASRLT